MNSPMSWLVSGAGIQTHTSLPSPDMTLQTLEARGCGREVLHPVCTLVTWELPKGWPSSSLREPGMTGPTWSLSVSVYLTHLKVNLCAKIQGTVLRAERSNLCLELTMGISNLVNA